jgi:hypothetical protein
MLNTRLLNLITVLTTSKGRVLTASDAEFFYSDAEYIAPEAEGDARNAG